MNGVDEPSALDALIDENMALRAELAARESASPAPEAAVAESPVAEEPVAGEDESVDPEAAPRGFGRVGLRFSDVATDNGHGEAVDSEIDVAALIAERDTYLADSQRLAADFANYRKQSDKRVAETAAAQSAGLVRGLLPVLDACDSALEQDPESPVAPIRGALLGELEKTGLELVAPAAGDPFDPELHEAVMHEDGETEAAPAVAEVFRSGYVWKGKVVRPAMVKVIG